MPPLKWTTDPIQLVQSFERRHHPPTDAGALFVWAAWTVESLHYLDDLDAAYESNPPNAGHQRDIIDVAHARWATGTSITAVDLCAAGLGQALCQQRKPHELKLADFDPDPYAKIPQQVKRGQRRAQLPVPAQGWIISACTDPQYETIKEARNWLTHSRMPRIVSLGPTRLELRLGTTPIGVRELVETARDYATQHVSGLLQMIPQL
jgi:hypothetical protein